ncbi:protein SLOW GREEN 1, chloroplastic isoform X1 [Pyrus x bretschneideri]|uniref:protein SLOW GREEN 1, chloroplastic isoform X1 n=1 Tax=Pyrus x bretschneideri TaxID=225117 RepID=UPI000510C78C|nr:protein SLOW GREEN 1, chloroplastic isoform X1 [Pyrus x bretschneideri]
MVWGSCAASASACSLPLLEVEILSHNRKPSFLHSNSHPLALRQRRSSTLTNYSTPSSSSSSCSKLQPSLCFQPHKTKDSSTTLPQKALVGFVVLGSVFFAGFGCFKWAAVSRAAQTTPNLEDKTETTHQGKIEEEEEQMYHKILVDDPKNVGALKVVLYGKLRRGKAEEAVSYVERLIELEPHELEWRLMLPLCYEIMGQLTCAKTLYQQILEDRPLLLRALHGLALVMHKNHEGPAVFSMLNKALEIARREKRVVEERNIRILIAQMHVIMGELEEGLNKFQDLVNADPRDFRPYLCRGIIYSLLDQKKEAAEQFETYRALVPEEFPQRGFLNDVVLAAANNKCGEQFKKDFHKEFSYRK